MKKIILTLLVTLMVLTVGVVNVSADGNVAKIDDTEYPTLQDAMKVVGDNQTIYLLDDIELIGDQEITIPIDKTVTIDGLKADGGMYTISFEKKSVFNKAGLTGNTSLTVNNVKFIGTDPSTASYPIVSGRNFTGKINLNNCTFTSIRKCAVYMDPNGEKEAKLSIVDCTYDKTPIGYSVDMTRPSTNPFNVDVNFSNNTGYEVEYEIFNDTVLKDNNGKFKGQYSLEAAIDAANNNDVIEILKDCEIVEQITINKKIVLDLKDHTVTAQGNPFLIEYGDLTITGTGTLKENQNNGYYGIRLIGSTDPTDENYSNLTIDKDVTIEGTGYGFSINNNDGCAYGVNVDVYGTVESVYGTTINGSINKTTGNVPNIHFYPGSYNNGIYAAGYANWILEGDQIAVKDPDDEDAPVSGISIKSGTFTIKSGTYSGIGTYTDPASGNNNGSEETGAGISITTNDSYAKITKVTIEGGVFESENGPAFYEGIAIDKSSQPMASASQAVISITGGYFTGARSKDALIIKEANNKKVVSGGWFSSKVPNTIEEDYVASGYKASDDLTGKGAPNSVNVYTVIRDVPADELDNKETGIVKVGGKDIDTTFGTKVTIDETLPPEEKAKISSIQVSNLNKAISTTEKNDSISSAAIEAKDATSPTAEVEVIMNVELAKSSVVKSLAKMIEEDKADNYNPDEVEYIDISIDKIVKANGNVIEIKEIKKTDSYQLISFPVASVFGTSADKEKVFVYRNHIDEQGKETNVSFTKVEKDYGPIYNGECYWIDGDSIYVKAYYFSVYGFGIQNTIIPAEKKPSPSHRYSVPNTGIR